MNKSVSDLPAAAATANGWPAFRLGMVWYGLLFVVVLPVGLLTWAHFAAPNVSLPAVQMPALGSALLVLGGALMAWATSALWHFGQGLPMSPYPPPRYVTRGPYRLVHHPLYVGFCLLCVGSALILGSAAGLWLVCPTVILGCAAWVLGYENLDLQARFGPHRPEPLLRLAAAGDEPPALADRLSVYVLVFLPWLAFYELLATIRPPATAFALFLPFEFFLPVWEWTELLYAAAYLLVLLAPWVAPTKRALRNFALQGLAGTGLMLLFFTALPIIAPPRPFAPQTPLGHLLAFERALDTPANAFPSYHVFWALLAVSVFARRRVVWWIPGVLICASTVTTGMHAIADVLAGLALFLLTSNGLKVWAWLRSVTERIANSWQEWRWGRVRIINHGLYAGIGAALALAIVGALLGPGYAAASLLVALSGLASAGLWAQFVEGSPSLLRPYGYYGGVVGIILGSLLATVCFHVNPWLLLAAYCVAGPWVQSLGRLRCLVQGCCHGRPTSPQLGIVYRHPRSRVCRLAGMQGVPIHPTPLYSILWNVVLAAFMARLWFVHAPLGLLAGLYLLLTGLGRFVEEAYRGEPQTHSFAGLRFYQWLGLMTLLAGAVVTCLPTPPAPSGWHLTFLNLALALAFGAVTWFALGVDFPESNRRFARLT